MNEQDHIYHQMALILKEINSLMENYEFWRLKLVGSNLSEEKEHSDDLPTHFGKEVEHQKYLLSRKRKKNGYDYQVLALDIASLLKECGIPLSTQQIHQKISDKGYVVSRSNLSSNILQRINADPKVNVERAYRGFWQYRLK